MASIDSELNLKPKPKTSECKHFTAAEKILFFVAICGLILCITLLTGLGIMISHHTGCNKTNTDNKFEKREIPNLFNLVTLNDDLVVNKAATNNSCRETCTSPICQDEASFFLKNINQEIDPCDNFYQFACGNFVKNIIIPDDTNRITMFSITQKKVIYELIDEIKGVIKANDLNAFKALKIYYQNCMNESRVQEEGTSVFLKLLDEMGGWPVLLGDEWKDNDWVETLFKIKDSGYTFAFPAMVYVEIDPKNIANNIITVLDAKTRVNEAFFLEGPNSTILKAYYDYMVDIARMLGADKDTAVREMKQCLDFEVNLFNIQMPMEQMLNSTINYNPLTIRQLAEKYPSIPWLAILNKLLNSSGIVIDENEVVIVFDLKFFSELENLISRTPKRVLANYLLWQVVIDAVDHLPNVFRDRQHNFTRTIGGVKEPKARSYTCVEDVMELFPISLSALYVRRHFDRELQQGVLELVKDVKDQFRKMLEKVDWMDGKTKRAAVEKLDAMDVFVGYADELLDDQKINDYYKDVEINYGSYLESAFNVTRFFTKQYYKRLRKPVNKKDWTSNKNAAIINAYYYRHKNTFEIPAGLLRGSFFHSNRPKYLNFGALGSIIGHEITHGFDNEGRKNDKNGKRIDWWQEDIKVKYLEKVKCIVDQYSNYTVHQIGHKLNGNLLQGENIADNGGYKAAYYAYDEWTKRLGTIEQCLPGLNYSARQLFWISAASNWCSKQKDEQLKLVIPNDSHSPAEARVVIPFSNIREFAEDFDCKLGSKMNPVKKCIVW